MVITSRKVFTRLPIISHMLNSYSWSLLLIKQQLLVLMVCYYNFSKCHVPIIKKLYIQWPFKIAFLKIGCISVVKQIHIKAAGFNLNTIPKVSVCVCMLMSSPGIHGPCMLIHYRKKSKHFHATWQFHIYLTIIMYYV